MCFESLENTLEQGELGLLHGIAECHGDRCAVGIGEVLEWILVSD